MTDYQMFYKRKLPAGKWPDDRHWDLFISSYNSSERVRRVFQNLAATEKHWLISPEYGYTDNECPNGKKFPLRGENEAEYMESYLNLLHHDLAAINICVDITGFIRPHLMFLLRRFMQKGIRSFEALYSEPNQYIDKEKTDFSVGAVTEVRQVIGFEGVHDPNTINDLLIIGSGYDDRLIAYAAESKNNARKIQLLGLPSLRPDMYQENVLRADLAAEAIGIGAGDEFDNFFAPAYDPFVTACVLREIVERNNAMEEITNLYLCPLATKAQVLGFALYFLTERQNTATSIIYPFSDRYSKQTSRGVTRIWQYTVELPEISE